MQKQGKRDNRRNVTTATPGVFKRVKPDGTVCDYVVTFTVGGKPKKEIARTYAEARRLKRARETDRDRGEFQARSNVKLTAYIREWVETYRGNGRRGFREGTRDEYRRLLNQYALVYFSDKLRLVDLTPRDLNGFVRWLCDPKQHDGRKLADETVKNVVNPLRSALATAQRDGLIRFNPATNLVLPKTEQIEDEDENVKAMSRQELADVLRLIPPRYRLMFELLAATGLRISEALGLQRKHLQLNGSNPHLRVRRAIVRRREEPPKTKFGRREVPLSPDLVLQLRAHMSGRPEGDETLVFATRNETPFDDNNVRRVLRPLAEEAGVPWVSPHNFRHTYASLQILRGTNIVQLSRVLGHHSASFTLERYAHLIEGEHAPPLDLHQELAGQGWGNETGRNETNSIFTFQEEIAA